MDKKTLPPLRRLVVLAVLACLVGAHSARAQYRPMIVHDAGSIHGRVRLAAGSQLPPGLAITKDDAVCGTTPSLSRLVIGRDRGVQYAVISLKGITTGKRFPPRRRTVLDQQQCEFFPHVVLMQRDAPLEVVNNDRVLHNVHAYALAGTPTTLFNIAQPIRGQKSQIAPSQFRDAGLVMVTCDAGHPWMSGYIVRVEHPYYAVTDANGSFRIDDIPPGTYTLAMWHEGVAVRRTDMEKGKITKYTFEAPYSETRQIVVPPRRSLQVDFDLTLR